jgi:arylsulfatase A-like enzyme
MPTVLSAAGLEPPEGQADGCDVARVAADGGDRTVYSFHDSGAKATYMATNRRWKYYYSVPDRREYLFDRERDPDETRNRANSPFRRKVAAQMREGLMEFYREAGFTAPLDGDEWKDFPQPTVPEDPDAGLLIQDAGWARPYMAIPGYTDED